MLFFIFKFIEKSLFLKKDLYLEVNLSLFMRENRKRHNMLYISITAIIGLIIIGTVMYHRLENWTYISSFYFSVATLTTVGYGDLAPTNDISRLFTAVYILVGVTVAIAALTTIGKEYVTVKERSLQSKFNSVMHKMTNSKTAKKK